MKIRATVWRSALGRKIFLLFLVSAFVPVFILLVFSYRSVTENLRKQGQDRLHALAKTYVMEIWERLSFLDIELQMVAAELKQTPAPPFPPLVDLLGEDLSSRFSRVTLVAQNGRSTGLYGMALPEPDLEAEAAGHLRSGRPLLIIRSNEAGDPEILLGRQVDTETSTVGTLWSEINPLYLWWGPTFDSTLPAEHEMAVVNGADDRTIYSTVSTVDGAADALRRSGVKASQGRFQWKHNQEDYFAEHRLASLRPVFLNPGLQVIISQPQSAMYLPLADFRRTFVAVVLLSLWVVILLSLRSIRSSLAPLEKLREGTQKISAGDLDFQLQIHTKDEVEDLATSFNSMATSLKRQFSTLSTLNRLQEGILSSATTEELIAPILSEFPKVLPCYDLNISVIYPKLGGAGRRFSSRLRADGQLESESITVSELETAELQANPKAYYLDSTWGGLSYYKLQPDSEVERVIAFPAFLKGELALLVAAGLVSSKRPDPADVERARQLTDQIAVALSNSRLIEELDDLNWGTLTALARAIDVRSHWTMGHTERVSNLAQKIGREFGLSTERLHALHRGCLLHDIGKIGIPSTILDKPSKLTPDEMEKIREHVAMGVRIIEPIPGLADALPIVLQHHEWYNGAGYPAGLSGEQICFEARILSIVDCYDALRSARPYRPALGEKEVLEYIQGRSGYQFDPEVTTVLIQLVAPSMLTSERRRELSPRMDGPARQNRDDASQNLN